MTDTLSFNGKVIQLLVELGVDMPNLDKLDYLKHYLSEDEYASVDEIINRVVPE